MSNFKKGDRVQYSDVGGFSDLNGEVGTIMEVKSHDLFNVKWDNGRQRNHHVEYLQLILIEPKTRLQELMNQYKATRALHEKAKQRERLAKEERERLANQLNGDRNQLLAEIDKITVPE